MELRMCHKKLSTTNDWNLALASPQERILRIISEIYEPSPLSSIQGKGVGSMKEVAESPSLQLSLRCPAPKLAIGLLSDSPLPTSAFLRWYTGVVPNNKPALNKSETEPTIQILTSGRSKELLDGESTLMYFPTLLRGVSSLPAIDKALSSEVSVSRKNSFSCCDFIIFPLVHPPLTTPTSSASSPSITSAPDISSAVSVLTHSCDLIFVFFSASRPLPSLRLLSLLSHLLQSSPDPLLFATRLRFFIVDSQRGKSQKLSDATVSLLPKLIHSLNHEIPHVSLSPEDVLLLSFPSVPDDMSSPPSLGSSALPPSSPPIPPPPQCAQGEEQLQQLCDQIDEAVEKEVSARVRKLKEDAVRVKEAIESKMADNRKQRRRNVKLHYIGNLLIKCSMGALWSSVPILLLLLLSLHPPSTFHFTSFSSRVGLGGPAEGLVRMSKALDSALLVGLASFLILLSILLLHIKTVIGLPVPTLKRANVLELKGYKGFCEEVIAYCN